MIIPAAMLSCCCTSAVFSSVASSADEPDAAEFASRVGFVARIGLVVAVCALQRSVTIGAVVAGLRGEVSDGTSALRSAVERWPVQFGLGFVRLFLEVAPVYVVFTSSGWARPARTILVALVYFAASTFMRSRVGPAASIAIAESTGMFEALRRGVALVNGHRAAYVRVRAAFGAIALVLCGSATIPVLTNYGVIFEPNDYGVATASQRAMFGGGVLVFLVFAYVLFVLDAALDTAFHARAKGDTGTA